MVPDWTKADMKGLRAAFAAIDWQEKLEGRASTEPKMEIGAAKKGDKIGAKSGHFQREL